MPPSQLLDKLIKGRRKRPSASGSLYSTSTPPGTPRGNVLRTLTNVANRTFHMGLPRPQESLISMQGDDVGGGSSSNVILDGQRHATPPGPESQFNISPGARVPADVGAWSAAGWHLVADTTGSGQAIKARKPNQDSFGVLGPVLGSGLYMSVFDGHGMHGREASQVARDTVPVSMTQTLQAAVERGARFGTIERRRAFARAYTRAFADAERALRDEKHGVDHAFSGTTATCVWLDGAELLCAWVGDSRAVLGRREGNVTRAVDLTSDHKPTRRDEKKRVRAAGGRVTRWQQGVGPQRVWLPDEWLPGLAMTRSVGDTVLTRYGVVAHPEVTATAIGPREEFIVVASDGVWEFMTSDDVVALVAAEKATGAKAAEVARKLVDEAVSRWREYEQVVDDTTAIVAFLNVSRDRRSSVFSQPVDDSRTRSLSLRFRKGKSDHRLDKHVGQPWLINANGKLEAFSAACGALSDGDEADDIDDAEEDDEDEDRFVDEEDEDEVSGNNVLDEQSKARKGSKGEEVDTGDGESS